MIEDSMAKFVVIMAQGRSGSTLLLRMLNAVPGVRISGENEKAIDHLRLFLESFQGAVKHHHSDFYKLAWQLPASLDDLKAKTARYLNDIYNPGGTYKLAGFKEIRYGRAYDDLTRDVKFLGEMFPDLKIVFNTRLTDDAVKSEFWTEDPALSRQILNTTRANFERFHAENPRFTYMMPFEEFHKGSAVLEGMFDFLGIEFTRAARAELKVRLK
jgi:sulfotransferase family protein